jgi:CysZ protein
MSRLPTALALAFAQLGDPRVLKVLGKSLAVTLAIFAALGLALWRGLAWSLDSYAAGYGGELGALIAIVLAVIAGWLLFRIVALAVLQFFADEVVLAVEARHYPEAAASARRLPFREDLRNAVSGAARAVIVNLVALPFAVVLLVTGIGTALLFWAVNAWLLGRELEQMAWLRHRHESDARSPVGATTRFLLGGIVAAMLLVPFVNFIAPVLGAAAATHLVHRRRTAADAA